MMSRASVALPFHALALIALCITLASPASHAQSGDVVRVVSDASGERLQVNGRDTMVFGMNWDYSPIGTNYSYDFWGQPDEFIEAALAREMPLMKDMGVNAIRVYNGIPARWVTHIYERYGIYTIINHPMARYGYTLDGAWIGNTDYANPRLREAVKAEILALVEEFQNTPGLLMWLLGNENNYGLSWTSFEIEALPEGERNTAQARFLYSLFGEIIDGIKEIDANHPVAIANGDIQYIDLIAEECKNLDILGTNCYRGISARDLYDEVKTKLGIPVVYTEFGSDAFNARDMREDQIMQARYLIGQWQEIYEMSAGKGRTGNCIGGMIFQWTDGWWKFKQEERLDIHDTNASWPNGGYDDFVEGDNNMNEEWWGITAKGYPDMSGQYDVYPRAAYYALRQAFQLDPYAPDTDLEKIRAHFGACHPASAALEARGNTAAVAAGTASRVRLSGVRLEFETYSTGGERISTPEAAGSGTPTQYPAFQGFDQMQSFYADFEAKPSDAIMGRLSVNILGSVPTAPINEIFYENRGRPVTVVGEDGEDVTLNDAERVRVYQAEISWDDRWFNLDAFYRTGHLHWQYEGDFFGLYRDAFYGENIDIYNGQAPVGVEIEGKKTLKGLKVAYGPELWWGANPAAFLKYQRRVWKWDATAMYQEDLKDKATSATSSLAIPIPRTRKVTLQFQGSRGNIKYEVGGIWAGNNKVDDTFQIAEEDGDSYQILEDRVKDSDTFGGKAKVTYQKGRWNWYAEGGMMGIVADGGPTSIPTFTGWHLRDTGSGNKSHVVTGIAMQAGDFQISPNFLYQKPMVGPVPGDAPAPGRARNVLDDPFAVLGSREMTAGELLITYDPTPATWMWQWDNDVREDAKFAAALGYVYSHFPTTRDATLFVAEDGRTIYAFGAAPPARDHWELWSRIVSNPRRNVRLIANLFVGTGEGNGFDVTGEDKKMNRKLQRGGGHARLVWGQQAFEAGAAFNDWGPYDYHRDFNETFPVQLLADASHTLGKPSWFGFPQTKFGVRYTWRSLDQNSPRYCPGQTPDALGNLECDPTLEGDDGAEWEFRTYLHFAM